MGVPVHKRVLIVPRNADLLTAELHTTKNGNQKGGRKQLKRVAARGGPVHEANQDSEAAPLVSVAAAGLESSTDTRAFSARFSLSSACRGVLRAPVAAES